MRIVPNLSLRQKIIAIILVTCALVLVLGFALITLYKFQADRQQLSQRLAEDASLIGDTCLVPLRKRDQTEAESLLSRLQVKPYIVQAILYGPDRDVFAVFDRSGKGPRPPFPPEDISPYAAGGVLHLVRSITVDDEIYGKLYLRASMQELRDNRTFFLITLATLGVFLLGMAYFGARFLQKSISQPIMGLVSLTKKVSGAQESSVRLMREGKDEVSILRERFQAILNSASLPAGYPPGTEEMSEPGEDIPVEPEDIFRRIFDQMSLGIAVLTPQERGKEFILSHINPACERMERIHRDDALGQPISEAFPGVTQQGLLTVLQRVLHTGIAEKHSPSKLRDDGDAGWRESTVFPLATGEIVMVFSDVSDRVKREDAQREREEELLAERENAEPQALKMRASLEAANRELAAFFFALSHDMRAPLENLDEFTKSMLQDYAGALDDRGKNLLIQLRAASHRLAQLFNEMDTLAQISFQAVKEETVDLTAAARKKSLELRDGSPDRKVEFVIQEDVKAQGDPQLLQLIIDQLFTNAWLCTAQQATTKIEFGVSGENPPEFFVKDNGTGFDTADAEKMFTPFQKLHTEEVYPGMGMGLAIVRRIVHRHGGTIRAQGEPGKGAAFYFTL